MRFCFTPIARLYRDYTNNLNMHYYFADIPSRKYYINIHCTSSYVSGRHYRTCLLVLTSSHDKDSIYISVHRYRIALLILLTSLRDKHNCISAHTHHYRTLALHASLLGMQAKWQGLLT